MTESFALTRPFNNSWNVGNDEFSFRIKTYNTKVRLKRGERIVRNLWLCRRHRANECALPSIWKTDQRNIGHQFQFKF